MAGTRSLLAEAAASVAGPTTGVVPAAADEVSAAISAVFGNFGQEFQLLSAQAQAFHAEFVNLMNAGAGAYLSAEIANAEQTLANAVNAPAGAASAAHSVSASSLLGGILGGGSTSGGSLLGGPTGGTGVGGLLGGLTGGLGGLSSLGSNLNSIFSGVLPGLPTTLTGLENSLTGIVNSLVPGLVRVQLGGGAFYTGIEGPYEALFYSTMANLQNLGASWLADPFPFLRQFVANQMGYGQIIATALQTGNVQPVTAIPGDIAHNLNNVVATLTNTSITPVLDVSLLPTSVTLNNVIGLPVVLGVDLLGPPAATLDAASFSAATFATAVQAGNPAAAITALIDAPAIIANGFLNGQATFPYAVNLSNPTAPLGLSLGSLVNVSVVENLPLDGILVAPGYYAATVTVTSALNPVLPPIVLDVGVGGTPFSGILPFLVNYAPQQFAQAIGAPASPPPLISLPI